MEQRRICSGLPTFTKSNNLRTEKLLAFLVTRVRTRLTKITWCPFPFSVHLRGVWAWAWLKFSPTSFGLSRFPFRKILEHKSQTTTFGKHKLHQNPRFFIKLLEKGTSIKENKQRTLGKSEVEFRMVNKLPILKKNNSILPSVWTPATVMGPLTVAYLDYADNWGDS